MHLNEYIYTKMTTLLTLINYTLLVFIVTKYNIGNAFHSNNLKRNRFKYRYVYYSSKTESIPIVPSLVNIENKINKFLALKPIIIKNLFEK